MGRPEAGGFVLHCDSFAVVFRCDESVQSRMSNTGSDVAESGTVSSDRYEDHHSEPARDQLHAHCPGNTLQYGFSIADLSIPWRRQFQCNGGSTEGFDHRGYRHKSLSAPLGSTVIAYTQDDGPCDLSAGSLA